MGVTSYKFEAMGEGLREVSNGDLGFWSYLCGYIKFLVLEVKIIVAIGRNGSIGKKGDLIWSLPGDLKRFKALTMGHPVIMGRKTWESLPKRPLPGRTNIVLSRSSDFNPEGALKVDNVTEALDICMKVSPESSEVFVIGGGEIYKAFLPHATSLELTEVDAECEDADTFLDLNLENEWEKTHEEEILHTPEGTPYQYKTYQRKK